MYKVFINEKEVRFLTDRAPLPNDGKMLNKNLHPHELVHFIRTEHTGNTRKFYIASENPIKHFEQFLDAFQLIRAAGGIVRLNSEDGNILMIHRLGKWDLPKGKIDPGELQESAAIREVCEECGIPDLKIIRKITNSFHMYELKGKWVIKMTYWYLMLSNYTGKLVPQTSEGITEVKWVPEKEVYFLLPDTYTSISDLLLNEVLHR